MKNFIAANSRPHDKRYDPKLIKILLEAQIDNSIELGWSPKDIILLSNFEFIFMGVEAEVIQLNDYCWTGSKMFALKWFIDNHGIEETLWAHDLDAWQNYWFDEPVFDGDVGASQYSNPKFNGGSIFWRKGSIDIIENVVEKLGENKEAKEEPTLNKVFKSKEFNDRVAVLDYSYNVGCSGFRKRYNRSVKPIRVCHFHPGNSIAWEIHALDREEMGIVAVTIRLERLLRRYYPSMATMLNPNKKGKRRK